MESRLEKALAKGAPIAVDNAIQKLQSAGLTCHQFMDTEYLANRLIQRGYCPEKGPKITEAVAKGIQPTLITLIEYITPGKRCLFSGERQSYGLEKFIKRYDLEEIMGQRILDAVAKGTNDAYELCLLKITQGSVNRDSETEFAQKLLNEYRDSLLLEQAPKLQEALDNGAKNTFDAYLERIRLGENIGHYMTKAEELGKKYSFSLEELEAAQRIGIVRALNTAQGIKG